MGSKGWESALGGIGYGYREDIANNKTSRLILGAGAQESTLEEGSDATRMGLGGIASRANGGPVYSGRPYLVGERGPEIVVPRQSGYVFPNQSRRKRRTDAFFPTAPENYTPANQMPAMPDLSGSGEQQGMNPMESISQLVSLQTKPKSDSRFPVVDPATVGVGLPGQEGLSIQENPNLALNSTAPQQTDPQKKGIYDDWKQPVFGNMPLDKFVQLTGMMANAVAPDEWSGRLGKQMAAVATQADIDRRDYEEREQQRADINKKYEDQQKEKRMDKALEFAMKTDNAPLAKAAYGQLKGQWEQDFGVPLPDWNPEATPDLMKQLSAYKKGAKELGLSPEEQKKGEAEILLAGGEINGKEYLEATYPKAEKENETWSDPYETNVGGKKALVQKSSTGKITPVIQDKSTTVITPGDKSKTKEKLAVYVDTVNGARHVVDLNNQKHREWLAKYGKQLRAEKDFEKDVVTPEEGTETSDPLGIR